MEYIQSSFQHFSQPPNHDHMMSLMASGSYNDHQHLIHGYSLSQHQSNMMNIPNGQKTNETKPRLGKEEVDILEREFKINPKPSTQLKRTFAEDMGVDLSRINNWFQNRRAKRKQEKKTEEYEAGQAREALGYSVSAPSSPEFSQSNYSIDYQMAQPQPSSMSYPTTGPPPATAPYNPQYPDPTTASLQSLKRTVAAAEAAQAASQSGEFCRGYDLQRTGYQSLERTVAAAQASSQSGEFSHGYDLQQTGSDHFANMQGLAVPSDIDHAQFPTDMNYPNYNGASLNLQPTFNNDMFHGPQPLDSSVTGESDHTPVAYNTFSENVTRSLSTASASSQVIPQPFTNILAFRPQESSDNQASDHSLEPTAFLGPSVDWQFSSHKDESSLSPPPASSLFKSPPPPTDLAARRKKVQVKPAALGTDTMRNRPPMGPRTMSNIDGFRRHGASPLPSPMRRIVSAGGNRNVLHGRIQKSGVESAQRSPINMQGFENTLMEQHYHMMNQPSLTAGSSLTSSLAPPTPMSPRERPMTLKRDSSSSNENLYLYHGVSTFNDPSQAIDQTPPETPHAPLGLLQTPVSGWQSSTEHHNPDQHFNFEVPDDALYTPNHDSFATELSMPQSSYVSQPVTPAFGNFNQRGLVLGNGLDSPQFNNNNASPLYPLSNQGGPAEYAFPHDGLPNFSNLGLVGSSPTMTTKQKQYQFSNVTQADYSEK